MKGIERFVESPLGFDSFVVRRKEWIASAIGVLGGLGTSLLGGSAASAAAEKSLKHQRQMESKEDAWYNRRYYEDYADTNAGQNLVRRAKQIYDRSIRRAAGAKAVSGGTAASVQMAKDSANQAIGDTMANIAATDQMRKAQVDDQHMQNQRQFAQMDMNREMQRAQNISNAASAASNAMMSIGSAVDQASAKSTNLQGGSNNSTEVAKSPSVDFDAIRKSTPYYANMSDQNILANLDKINATNLGQ